MNEGEWLHADSPEPMLRALRKLAVVVPARKYRHFSCACCRRMVGLLTDDEAVVLEELDRQALSCLRKDILALRRRIHSVEHRIGASPEQSAARQALEEASAAKATDAARCFASIARALGEWREHPGFSFRGPPPSPAELNFQANLLRDIVGNFFRPVAIDPGWLAWNDRTIPKMAQIAFETREMPSGYLDAGRLAILADALEEARCTHEELLAHLRSPGPHVRGCWAVDLILSKDR